MSRPRSGLGQRSKSVVIDLGDDIKRRTSQDALNLAGITAESPLDGSTVQGVLNALDEAEPAAAKERALRLLGYRERSVHELTTRLQADGYPSEIVDATVARLRDLSLVDDERFASLLVRSKISAGWGRRKIQRALQEHCLTESIALDAIEENCPQVDEATRAADLLRSRTLETQKDRDWAMRRLVRRGFSYTAARAAIDLIKETHNSI